MTAASPILRFWVDMATECVRRDHTPIDSAGDQRGPFLTARALGMAMAALHDAKAIAEGRPGLLDPAPAVPPGLAGASPDLAAAAACHQLLLKRYPKQAPFLSPAWIRWLGLYNPAGSGGASEPAGRAFGDAVHALGGNDPTFAAAGMFPPPPIPPYVHAPPPNQPTQGYSGGLWGNANRLASVAVTGFPGPPGRISGAVVNPTAHFVADFDKVKVKGVNLGSTRTADEEVMGIFWGYDGPPELGTPPRLYMQVVLTALDAIELDKVERLSVNDELAVIAGAALAMADAGIEAWHYKYAPTHMMWRPVVGIQNAQAGNGVAIPGWLPLGRPDTNGTGLWLTPDFPAYPSGHATFGAAAFGVLRMFLVEKGVTAFRKNGDDTFDFDFVSDEYNGRNTDARTGRARDRITRGFTSLWSAILENSVSRVFLGVHWQFDGLTQRNSAGTDDEFAAVLPMPDKLGHTGGVWLGSQVAKQVAAKLGVSATTIAASKA